MGAEKGFRIYNTGFGSIQLSDRCSLSNYLSIFQPPVWSAHSLTTYTHYTDLTCLSGTAYELICRTKVSITSLQSVESHIQIKVYLLYILFFPI